ncbi:MAG: ATP synthase F0 subunit C [Clostridiales bacterium]|nr:ATP synthase F0 subunit C [Clostridiales bacterium]
MKTMKKNISALLIALVALLVLAVPAFAAETGVPADDQSAQTTVTEAAEDEETSEDTVTSTKAIASALAIGVAAVAGCIGMAMVSSKAVESIARQPEAEGKIRTTLMLGLVFIETAIIYALLAVILIIFVL